MQISVNTYIFYTIKNFLDINCIRNLARMIYIDVCFKKTSTSLIITIYRVPAI